MYVTDYRGDRGTSKWESGRCQMGSADVMLGNANVQGLTRALQEQEI